MDALFTKLAVWYWTRYYKKQFTENPPDTPEMLEMAQRAGSVREYKKLLTKKGQSDE